MSVISQLSCSHFQQWATSFTLVGYNNRWSQIQTYSTVFWRIILFYTGLCLRAFHSSDTSLLYCLSNFDMSFAWRLGQITNLPIRTIIWVFIPNFLSVAEGIVQVLLITSFILKKKTWSHCVTSCLLHCCQLHLDAVIWWSLWCWHNSAFIETKSCVYWCSLRKPSVACQTHRSQWPNSWSKPWQR